MNHIIKAKSNIILPIIIVIVSVFYVTLIFNQNIWTDEAFTIDLVNSGSVPDIISGTANDVHPPLYYLICKFFVSIFGSSIQVYKIVSIIPMVLTMLLAVFYIKPWFGQKSSVLFVLFFNAIPCVLEYSVQIRMYSWSIFFITLCSLSAYGIASNHRNVHWVLLSLSALCACYTHNFAMISAVFIYLLLGIALIVKARKLPAKWFLSGAFVSVCFLPWLLILLRQTTDRVNNYWIEKITLETVAEYFSDLFDSRLPFSTVMFVVLFLLILILSVRNTKKSEKQEGIYVLCLFLVPLLTAFTGIMVSILITPFFIARYLIPCMGLLALALAIGFSKENLATRIILCAFLVTMFLNSYYTNYIDEYHSSHTQELLTYMSENLGENDLILYNYKQYGFVYECYFDNDQLRYLEEMDFASDYDTIWYFDSCTSPWLPDATLTEYGLTKEYIATLGIEQNDFILYKITR